MNTPRLPSPSSRAAISRPATGCSRATTATTVRVRDGKTLTTDGPFAETREQLAGYYLVEAKDLDAALGDRRADSRGQGRFNRSAADLGL